MNRDILILANSVSKEKNVPEDVVFNVLEDVLSFLAKKKYTVGEYLAEIADDSGDYSVYRVYHVIDDNYDGEYDKNVHVYRDMASDVVTANGESAFLKDDSIYVPVELTFGRQQANQAKQVLAQKLRDVVFEENVKNFLDSDQGIVSGVIREFKKGIYIVDNGKMEFVLPKSECLPKDMFKVGQRVHAAFLRVERNKGIKKVILTRLGAEYINEVIKDNVNGVLEGAIEVVKIARIPGFKSKIILKSNDPFSRSNRYVTDPVKSFVGAKGANIKAISSELQGEIIEVYRFFEDPIEQLVELINPIEIEKVSLDEDSNVCNIVVMDMGKSILVGKTGANIKLVSELIGMDVQVYTHQEWEDREHNEAMEIVETFKRELDVDEELALVLIESGITSVDEVAYVPKEELLAIDGFDDNIVTELRERAKQSLLVNEIKQNEEKCFVFNKLEDLGFSKEEVVSLQEGGVKNVDDVADLALFELKDIIPTIGETRGTEILLKARGVV